MPQLVRVAHHRRATGYHFRFWRPYTAIRRADADGNPATEPDPDWLPLLWTSPEVMSRVYGGIHFLHAIEDGHR